MLHHCLKQNSLSCDSYYIVKNIIRQLITTVPVLGEYLLIGESNQSKFAKVIQEFLHCRSGKREVETLTEQNYPSVFVQMVKKLNELRLDFSVVIAITGIEAAFDENNL